MPFLDEAQPETRPRGGRFIDEEPAIPSSGLGPPPQTTDLLDRLADAASRGYRFYQQSELIREGVTPDSAKEISRLQQEIEQIPRGPGIERFQQAKGWRESFQAIADDPINTMGELMAESLGSLIPKAIKTIPAATALGAGAGLTLGGPAGLATGARGGFIAGTGITSGSLEYAGKVLEALQEAGIDTKDPEQLHNAFTNPGIIDDIKQRAIRKAVPIAAFDALSAGLAGRFLARPAASILGRVGQSGAELGQQVALAGTGEAAGELASGERLNPPSILAEMLLEPIAGAPEIATGVATRPRATRRIGEPTYATTQGEVQESVQPQRIETPPRGVPTEAGPGDIVQPTTPVQTQEETPDVLAPVFPLRPGTKGTPWEDQRGRPVRQNPDTKRYQVVPEEAPPEQKIAPVQFLQVQEGMPELVWYKLTGDITDPFGNVYPAGRNISNGELRRFGYTVPESELAKSSPSGIGPILKASPASANESPETGPFILRTAPGEREIKLGVNMQQLMALVGPQMYSKPIVEVAVKELVQNALDISRAAGSTRTNPKVIDVNLDPEGRTITVEDKGLGMTPDIIQSAFFTIGGTHKEGTPENTSGGLGLAKMAFILGSERIRLETIRGGVKSIVDASSDEIRNSTFKILQSKARPGEQSGTKVTVTIPKTYTNSEGEPQEIWFYHDSDFLKEPLIADVKVRLNGEELPLGVNLKGWQKENRFNFSWGHIDMYIDPTRSSYPRTKVLSSGLYQFEDYVNWGDVQFPYNIVLDVRPKVKTDNAGYPFNNQREGWRGTVSEDVKAMHNYLQQMALENQLLEAKETFAGLQRLPKFDPTAEWSEQELEDFMARYRTGPKTSGATTQDKIKQIDFSGPTITFEFESGKTTKVKKQDYVQKSFRPERDINLGAATLDVSQIDPSEPQFHNNTTANFSEVPGSTAMFAEIGNTLLLFMRDFGNRIQRYNALAETSPTGWFGGISIDKSYRGLNMIKPMKAIWFNPAMMSQDALESPLAAASEALHIFIHEVTHVRARSEGADFTSELANNYARLRSSGLGVELYEKTLERIFAKHWDAFHSINGLVKDYNTKNRTASFKSSAATGPPTGAEQAGITGSPQIYAAGVGGVPEQGPGSTTGTRPTDSGTGATANVDDEGKPTEVFGVKDYVTERPVLTPEQLAAGRAHAKTIFDQAGLPVVEDPEMDGWRLVYDGEKKNNEGRKLIDLLTRELATQHQAGKPQLAPLINNIRLNFKYGTMDQLFDLPIRLKLYALSQGEASRRGMELRALAGLPEDITFVAQNIDVELQHIYSDMFGGEEIQKFLDKTKEATVKKMDKPVQDGVLAGKPEMQQEVDKANAARDPSAKIPSAQQLANEVFNQQFDSFDDLVNALKDRLMKEFKLSDADATKIAKKFKDTFEKPFKDAAQKSYEETRKALGQIIGSRKGIWDKIQKAINKGVFDNIQILREVAKAMGMRPPTEEEIKKMKGLAAREREMGSLTPKELEEHKKMGTTPAKLKEAMDARLASTNIARSQIRKQMEVLWTRFTKPIPGLSIDSWRGFKNTRRNLAAAINEFISANLLFKLGFPSRLGISVFSQWLVNTPTRAIANALVRYHDALAKGQTPTLYKDIAMHLGDSYRAQYNAIVPALESARAALLGRGEARNIDRLMSGIAAMDRIAAKAKEYWDAGDYGRGSLLWMLAQIRMGYRVAQSLDNLQGVPAEYSEMRARVINELLGQGMSRAEALNRADFVIGDMKQQHMEAVADTKKAWEAAGITGSANELSESAWDLVKQKQYQRIKELGLPADEFRDQIKFYRNVLAWNEAEHKGIGGGIARLLQRVEEVAEKKGIPTAITRFSNAIGITINRALAFTPFYKQADYGGYGTSGWFKIETDKQQRRVEALLGTTVGTAAFMMALSGMWLVRRKWPKDKEEQDLWQQEGHRPGTVEIPVGDGGSFIPMSLNNSPLMFVAPYLAAGGALHDLLVEREGQQKKLDEEAAKTGAVPGKIRPMSFGDMALVALEGAKQAVIGGRTPAATLASVTYYGLPNAKKMAASYVSPMVPGLPALQEVSRMAGVSLDDRFASVWDFMLPLPGSEARRLNMLGDPVKTPNDIQRITQIMTGGNYPLPVDAAEAKARPAYDALFNSGYRPPSINPQKGYQIGSQYRPMNNSELDKYIELRGKYLKEGLIGTGPYIDKAAAQKVYEDANQRALSEIGVQQPVRTSSTPRTTTTRRTTIRGPRRLRTRAGSRLRRPRIRRLSYRRPRLAVRRPRLRRIRRLAA